jgi:hypothetical protein
MSEDIDYDYWIENDTLHFDDMYDCIVPMKIICAMKKCQSIHFGMEFNKIIYAKRDKNYRIPKCITTIVFSEFSFFNKPLLSNEEPWLPPKLVKLVFGQCFNKSIHGLPETLESLTFGEDFNQPVDNLPSNLKYLTFGEDFDKTVDLLPDSLVILKFGTYFNQSIDNLPDSIKELSLGAKFKQKINKLPQSLEKLFIKGKLVDKADIQKLAIA